MKIIAESSIDAWISGLGSFLGALLAGLISAGVAIWIMNRQYKVARNENEINEIKNHLRTYLKYGIWYTAIDSLAEEVVKNLRDENQTTMDPLKELFNSYKKSVLMIKKLDDSQISSEIFVNFTTFNTYIQHFYEVLNKYINGDDFGETLILEEKLIMLQNQIRTKYQLLENFRRIKTKRLSELTKK